MEKNDKFKKQKKSENGRKDYFYKIIIVQFLACVFMAILLAVLCRLDSETIKEKYGALMTKDMSWHEVWKSAKETAGFVFKPVDADSIKESAESQEQIEKDESDEEDEQSDAEEEEKDTEPAETNEKNEERKTAEVLSLFSSDEDITLPLHGRISSRFGSRTDPISGSAAEHNAVDIAVKEGTKVAAAWDGIVTDAGTAAKKGNYIWMVHKNGCETLYCHLSELLVQKGDVIRAGETIALSGSTGYSTGPHLHFGIRKNGEMVNPLNYISESNGYV